MNEAMAGAGQAGEQAFAGWAVVEIFGHQKYAGLVRELAIAGTSLLRLQVPATEPSPYEVQTSAAVRSRRGYENYPEPKATAEYEKMFGGSAIFSLQPVTEEVARRVARQLEAGRATIVTELPPIEARALTAGALADDAEFDDEDDEPGRYSAGEVGADF